MWGEYFLFQEQWFLELPSQINRLVNNNEVSTSTKRVRKPTMEDVDTALLRWFNQLRSTQSDFLVSVEMLLDKLGKAVGRLSGIVSVMLGPSWISLGKIAMAFHLRNWWMRPLL